MISTPKAMRLHIALFGRTNVGKSSFLNMIAGQDVSVTSHVPGTTTDVVEKPLELLPVGPVNFLDTAGLDDVTELSAKRLDKTKKALDRADIAIIVTEPDKWSDFEEEIASSIKSKDIPLIIAVNKTDLGRPSQEFTEKVKSISRHVIYCSSVEDGVTPQQRERYINKVKDKIIDLLPKEFRQSLPIVGDLLPAGGLTVFIVPIDLQAPKGRLILPQVQSIRDALDNDAAVMVVKEREYANVLQMLNRKPDLVVCDSQVVMKMVADTPDDIKCTTFSILFSRFKGDLTEEVRGAAQIDKLQPGDKILIAEACSHHPLEDDIGRVKIPRWLRQYLGMDIGIDHVAGRDFPDNLNEYKVIIHCGGCMLTRTEKLARIEKAKNAGVPITNYGISISLVQGVLKRVLSPFPEALDALGS